jgi:N-methylhydantoinase A/oxoprolinase/acetone carboxylase beta subunit
MIETNRGAVVVFVYDRSSLDVGEIVTGPAVIEEKEATTYLDFGVTARVERNGSLEVTW